MKLYVICKSCGKKIYLTITANSRDELMSKLGSRTFRVRCPYCSCETTYNISEVMAEPGSVGAFTLLGALLGAAIGGAGGLILGGLIGACLDAEEKNRVEKFNKDLR